MEKIRQPIVTVAGHVDHGKTSILDSIRGTSIQEKEAGGITQKISFTEMPAENIKQRAGEVLEKFKIPLEIPGFLFIDTPGHAAFTNLRKRGGSLADLAVLVIDINSGIQPQTAEVIKLLKANKTPFIIALNKIDNISGYRKSQSGYFFDNQNQPINIKQNFDEKLYTLIGALNSYGFDAELYTEIKDFTKKIAIVPCSAITKEGISELIAMLAALSQKFLKTRITLRETAKGVILEVKKEKSANYLESILYDGILTTDKEIIIASLDKPVITKIRSMEKAKPLNKGFESVKQATGASGLRLQITSKEEILPGMPFQIIENNQEQLEKEFSKVEEQIQTQNTGILVKADSLGSLEALLTLLKQKQISVIKADIGDITKKDIYHATSLPDQDKVILGFNTKLRDDVTSDEKQQIKIITNDVVYKLIEDYEKYREEKQKQIEREKLSELPSIVKLKVLDFCFRNTSPCIFGVKLESGKLLKNTELINTNDEKLARVKTIQHEKSNIQEATKNQEVAISLPGINFERQLTIGENLYSQLSEFQFRKFKEYKDILTSDEKSILQEIARIKRKSNSTWGV